MNLEDAARGVIPYLRRLARDLKVGPDGEGQYDIDMLLACADDLERALPNRRRHQAARGECSECDAERARGSTFHPPHDASRACESGKRKHCSCDVCF